MAVTNLGGDRRSYPRWARRPELRMQFLYEGPSETGKQVLGYGWQRQGYSLEWLYRKAVGYDHDVAARMQRAGASAGCLVWSTGFSLENDQFHWEIMRKKIRQFHARGMHIIVYISLTNCFWQEMFATVPEAEGWRQMGFRGEPVGYTAVQWGDRVVTRYLMCPNNPDWRAYQRKRIKAALEAGADGVFWDNNQNKCHCPICREKFRAFTLQRFGQAHDLPEPIAEGAPSDADLLSAREVVFDWIPLSHPLAHVHLAKNLFRYQSIRDILEDLRKYAQRLRPDVVWSSNGHLCENIYDATNLLLSEDLDPVGYDRPSGRLRTNAGVLRYLYEECGRGVPAIVNSRHPETFAYGTMPSSERNPAVNDFLRRHAELYRDAQSPARVAVLATEMNYINHRANWFDNLVRHNLIFDVVPSHRLEKFDLSLYDVVLLRSILFLSDADCQRLRAFVAAGGTLVSTNGTSLYTENWTRRADYGLADVFGASAGDEGKPARVEHAFGAGRSIFYPAAVEREIERDPLGPAALAVAEDVRRHVRDRIVDLDAPPGVTATVMRAAAGTVVHVLNYTGRIARNVRVHLTNGPFLQALVKECTRAKPGRATPRRAQHPHPTMLRAVVPMGRGAARAVKLTLDDEGFSLVLPAVDAYTALVLGRNGYGKTKPRPARKPRR